MRVKVCGIRRREDADVAVSCGAWALGFVFHPPSPRYVSADEARGIARDLPGGVLRVGVFVDRPLEEVLETAERVGLDVVQLHGGESPEFARAIEGFEVWKAFRVGPDFDPGDFERYPDPIRILADAWRPGAPGGTGRTFDWSRVREAAGRRRLILAGGLRAENVVEAIETVRPWAIDASSGLEREPGVKDPERIREFFRRIRDWEKEQGRES